MLKEIFTIDPSTSDVHPSFLLHGQPNFRDLGGYKNVDNKKVKTGLVYRSGQLNDLNQQDILLLEQLELHTIVDFRSTQEIASKKNQIPPTVKNIIELSIDPGNLSYSNIEKMIQQGDTAASEQFLMDINQQLVLDNQNQYKAFFELLNKSSNMPLSFNCTAGKDRTGFAAALFLSALNVNIELIYTDYLQTNKRVESYVKKLIDTYNLKDPQQIQVVQNLMSVKKSYLQSAFQTIEQHYDSVENYLKQVLQVDTHYLQKIYLED